MPRPASKEPHLQYNDGNQILQFSGSKIRTTATEIGTLVTVTLRKYVDAGSTSFSLLVPMVNLDASNHAPVRTYGVTTIHRFSIVTILNHGQTENYLVTELHGRAAVVITAAETTAAGAGASAA
jgi:hypothetical protein